MTSEREREGVKCRVLVGGPLFIRIRQLDPSGTGRREQGGKNLKLNQFEPWFHGCESEIECVYV